MKRVIGVLGFSLVAVACGATSSTSATCALGPEFESSVVATDLAFDDFSSISPRQLQSTMSVLLLSVVRMTEVAPPDVVTSLERVDRAYSEISIALQAIAWDTSIADSDPLVAQALQILARSETIEAMTKLREFFSESCQTELKALPSRDVAGATTLPAPTNNLDPDQFQESSSDFDTEESALRSYGYYLASQIGETVTDAQAVCLGTALVEAADVATPLSPSEYDAFVMDALLSCVE